TVNNLPEWSFSSSSSKTLPFLPYTWEEFVVLWRKYWVLWANGKTFLRYLGTCLKFVFNVYVYVVCILVLLLPIKLIINRYVIKNNNDYDKESKTVLFFKKVEKALWFRVKSWIKSFIQFVIDNKTYYIFWLFLWGIYFNVFTIAIETIAYLIYFASSFDLLNVYRQVYKLALDLSNAINFIPGFIWLISITVLLEFLARKSGYDRLDRRECRNSAFLSERGVVTVVYGPMGAGKTKLITDMALTEEVRLRDMAFEIILESDFKFPNMTWATLEQELKQAIESRKVFSLSSVKKWLVKKYKAWVKNPCRELLFGYDYEHYGLEYNDGLMTYNVWQVLKDYCQAYLIYTVQSSLIQSNYSIRTDNLIDDVGNFPLWNTDFFRRDSRLMDSYSRHCHILDFDMLRLGKRVIQDNPNRYAFGFGVYVISEIDKERKNDKELRDNNVLATDKNANQRNDLFNALLKMSRHACVIANRVFVKVLADLQRPESLGADARELGEIEYIEDKGEMSPILPFFAPFYILEFIFSWLFGKFTNLYYKYRFNRSDKTALMYLLKNFTSWMKGIVDRTTNLYNSSTVKLKIESGRMDGASIEKKYFLQAKKIYSKRYSTDCLSGVFEQYAEKNTIGVDDLPEYASVMAREFELLKQNSFFQNEVRSYNKKEK
ncbi:MAG: hypothetical protein IJB32_01005, partial [Clostridia bacterium]|nr:hypothetical protein [Clostridia bacterium]